MHPGGVGAAARFVYPNGITYDFAGHLYVTDYWQTIRRVDVDTAQVTTIAGSPWEQGTVDGVGTDARFHGATNLTVDATGSLYVTERWHSTIRRLDVNTAQVSTLTGDPRIRRVQLGGLPTALNRPNAIVAVDDGRLLFSDENAILAIQ